MIPVINLTTTKATVVILFNLIVSVSIAQTLEVLPKSGTYNSTITVSIASIPGDTILYSLDGHYPIFPGHGVPYKGPFQVGSTDSVPVYSRINSVGDRNSVAVLNTLPDEGMRFPDSVEKIQVLHVYSTSLDTLISRHYWINAESIKSGSEGVLFISSDADSLFGIGERGGIMVTDGYWEGAGTRLIKHANDSNEVFFIFKGTTSSAIFSDSALVSFGVYDSVILLVNGTNRYHMDSIDVFNGNIQFWWQNIQVALQVTIDSVFGANSQLFVGVSDIRASELTSHPIPLFSIKPENTDEFDIPKSALRKIVTISYIEDGELQFSRKAWMQILGTGARHLQKKQLRLGFNRSMGGDLKYDLGLGPNRFERLYLTLGGIHQGGSFLSRVLAGHVAHEGGLGHLFYLQFKPVRTFIQGEDWGTYYLSHSNDERFIESKTGIPDDSIGFLRYHFWTDPNVAEHPAKAPDHPWAADHYNSIVNPFVENADLTVDSNRVQLWKFFNRKNFIDYFLFRAYAGTVEVFNTGYNDNEDFASIRGQYYFILGDLDKAYARVDLNPLMQLFTENEAGYHPSKILSQLKEVKKERDYILNRYSDMISTFLRPEIQKRVLNEIVEELRPYWDSEVERWLQQSILPYATWDSLYGSTMENYIDRKWSLMQGQFMGLFPGIDTTTVSFIVSPSPKKCAPGVMHISTLKNVTSIKRYSFTDLVSVPISAVPEFGFVFDQWKLNGETYSRNADTTVIFKSGQKHKIVAYFKKTIKKSCLRNELVVNEIVASNKSIIQDDLGKWPDYVEIYNPTKYKIDLGGLYVTDDPRQPFKHRLQEGLEINPKDFVVLFANNKDDNCANHLDFKLSKKGEAFYLMDITGSIISGTVYDNIRTDVSWSHKNGKYILCSPTPLEPNHLIGK